MDGALSFRGGRQSEPGMKAGMRPFFARSAPQGEDWADVCKIAVVFLFIVRGYLSARRRSVIFVDESFLAAGTSKSMAR